LIERRLGAAGMGLLWPDRSLGLFITDRARNLEFALALLPGRTDAANGFLRIVWGSLAGTASRLSPVTNRLVAAQSESA